MTLHEREEIIEKIMKEALSDVDLQASFEHYVVFNEIKIIKKEDLIK